MRTTIASRVRELRRGRRWTQADLAKRIGLSQARLSEVERGGGSFTAEQFLTILALFNVGVELFAPIGPDRERQLQNALARLGGRHLHEADDVLPSERLRDVHDVVLEALQPGHPPRVITALGPVLVRNIDVLHLAKLHAELSRAGLAARLAWVAENTLTALREELSSDLPAEWRRRYHRAEVVLGAYVEWAKRLQAREPDMPPDVVDTAVRSDRTMRELHRERSAISAWWRIVSAISPQDFASALGSARAGS